MKLFALALLALPLSAQTVVNPDRPSYTYMVSTPEKGLIQMEVGAYRSQAEDKSVWTSTPVMLRYGVCNSLEVRASFDGYTRFKSPDGIVDPSGYGDLTAGLKWNIGKLGENAFALLVTHKFQTASESKGLSTGKEDTSATAIMERQVGPVCVDINASNNFVGRRGASVVNVPSASICGTVSLTDAISLATEIYVAGKTEITTKQAVNQWVVGYRVSKKLVLDAAVGFGLNTDSPKFTASLGVSFGF